MDHLVITNIKSNKVKDVVDNELKFDSRNSLFNNPVKEPLPIMNVSLRCVTFLDRPWIQV